MRKLLWNLWEDESAQGTSEYILLLVALIAMALMFKDRIFKIVQEKMDSVGTQITDFK